MRNGILTLKINFVEFNVTTQIDYSAIMSKVWVILSYMVLLNFFYVNTFSHISSNKLPCFKILCLYLLTRIVNILLFNHI